MKRPLPPPLLGEVMRAFAMPKVLDGDAPSILAEAGEEDGWHCGDKITPKLRWSAELHLAHGRVKGGFEVNSVRVVALDWHAESGKRDAIERGYHFDLFRPYEFAGSKWRWPLGVDPYDPDAALRLALSAWGFTLRML